MLVEGYAEGLGGRGAAPRRPSWLRRLLGDRGPRVVPVTTREVLEHVVVRMTAATDRIAAAQDAGDEGMLNLRKAGEPERTRTQLAEFRDERLPRLLAALERREGQ